MVNTILYTFSRDAATNVFTATILFYGGNFFPNLLISFDGFVNLYCYNKIIFSLFIFWHVLLFRISIWYRAFYSLFRYGHLGGKKGGWNENFE
jgi:hypothetical protein